ncbi:MAG: hypothetical protein ACE5JO_08310, partial [Candidatus Binatia bacterium]
VAGAAAAVAFSFVVIGMFVRGTLGVRTYPRVNLLRSPVGRLLMHPAILFSLKSASAGVFILLILAGLLGNQYPLRNLAPTLVWIIWWVGMAYISALGGNLWALISPLKVLFEWAEALYRRIGPGGEFSRHLPYPQALGVWPGFLLFLAFSWVELVFSGSAVPANLAVMALGYSLITWTGMFLFGKEQWIKHGEAFSLVFGLLARFAPTEVRVVQPDACRACGLGCRDRDGECINCYVCFRRAEAVHREWNLRPYGVGLLRNEPVSGSMMAFVLLMLSTVTFDGFMATPTWANIESSLYGVLRDLGGVRVSAIRTLGLVTFPVLFLGIYLTVNGVIGAVSGWRLSAGRLARSFAFTLVPIAIAYHMAHYLSYLVTQGQRIIPLVSDPFGFGWDLLGTMGYRVNIGVVGARFGWYTAVVAIVLGHIIAVYLAHVVAIRTHEDRAPALRSQYGMSALMVAYTMVSLWILAQPIVERRTPSPVTAERSPSGVVTVVKIPQDALIPEPGTGRLQEAGEGRTAKTMITYRVLISPFHDGTRMTVADLLYPYIFAYRWGARTSQNDSAHDPFIEKSTTLIRGRLAGLRAIRVEKNVRGFGELRVVQELPVIEVYLKSPLKDPEQTASIAPPWNSLPWHLIVLMEEAVIRGWAAFSQEEAMLKGVEWLDLARGENVKRKLESLVKEFERRAYIPEVLKRFVPVQEAKERWVALEKFYREHGHFLVTNGPYILDKWSGDSAVLRVCRDLTYPLGVGSFDKYALPARANISKLDLRRDRMEISAEMEKIEKFQRTYSVVKEPLRKDSLVGVYPIKPISRYVVLSADGEVVKSGAARFGDDGRFTVNFKGDLKPGLYRVMIAIYLNENYVNPDVRMVRYRVEANEG